MPAPEKKVLLEAHLKKRNAVRDAVVALVKHHMPDATADRLDENMFAFGIDDHPVDGAHAARIMASPKGHEDMFPAFIHFSFSLHPDGMTQDHGLRSSDPYFDALRSDMNRLFTGTGAGEEFEIVGAKDEAGKPVYTSKLKKVSMSMSGSSPEGAINVIIYGTPEELYERMKTNLGENADLRDIVPKGGRGLNT